MRSRRTAEGDGDKLQVQTQPTLCDVCMETHTGLQNPPIGLGLPHMTSSGSFFGNHFLVGCMGRERGAAGFDIKAAATHDALLHAGIL